MDLVQPSRVRRGSTLDATIAAAVMRVAASCLVPAEDAASGGNRDGGGGAAADKPLDPANLAVVMTSLQVPRVRPLHAPNVIQGVDFAWQPVCPWPTFERGAGGGDDGGQEVAGEPEVVAAWEDAAAAGTPEAPMQPAEMPSSHLHFEKPESSGATGEATQQLASGLAARRGSSSVPAVATADSRGMYTIGVASSLDPCVCDTRNGAGGLGADMVQQPCASLEASRGADVRATAQAVSPDTLAASRPPGVVIPSISLTEVEPLADHLQDDSSCDDGGAPRGGRLVLALPSMPSPLHSPSGFGASPPRPTVLPSQPPAGKARQASRRSWMVPEGAGASAFAASMSGHSPSSNSRRSLLVPDTASSACAAARAAGGHSSSTGGMGDRGANGKPSHITFSQAPGSACDGMSPPVARMAAVRRASTFIADSAAGRLLLAQQQLQQYAARSPSGSGPPSPMPGGPLPLSPMAARRLGNPSSRSTSTPMGSACGSPAGGGAGPATDSAAAADGGGRMQSVQRRPSQLAMRPVANAVPMCFADDIWGPEQASAWVGQQC